MTPTPAENDANRLDYRTLVTLVCELQHRVTRLEQLMEMPEPRPELPEWALDDTTNDLLREMTYLLREHTALLRENADKLQELISLQREKMDHDA